MAKYRIVKRVISPDHKYFVIHKKFGFLWTEMNDGITRLCFDSAQEAIDYLKRWKRKEIHKRKYDGIVYKELEL